MIKVREDSWLSQWAVLSPEDENAFEKGLDQRDLTFSETLEYQRDKHVLWLLEFDGKSAYVTQSVCGDYMCVLYPHGVSSSVYTYQDSDRYLRSTLGKYVESSSGEVSIPILFLAVFLGTVLISGIAYALKRRCTRTRTVTLNNSRRY